VCDQIKYIVDSEEQDRGIAGRPGQGGAGLREGAFAAAAAAAAGGWLVVVACWGEQQAMQQVAGALASTTRS